MKNTNCRFDFHPVGQGLFYSGQINDFHFVYDCGTVSGSEYMKEAMDAYQAPKILDMLIVSHFHKDHINGIKFLLKNIKSVTEVILPYLYPAERLMVAAEYAIANDIDSLDDDYIAFLDTPQDYFDKAISVTFLHPDQPVIEWQNYEDQTQGRNIWFGEYVNINDFPELDNTQDRVTVRKHDSIYRTPIWGFKFYCQSGQVTPEKIRNKLYLKNIDPDNIATAIQDQLSDLKKVYLSLFEGSHKQNNISVVCCHGPTIPQRSTDAILEGNIQVQLKIPSPNGRSISLNNGFEFRGQLSYGCFSWTAYLRSGRFLFPPLQMLTGDANLKLDPYRMHFKHELRNVGLFLIPHHGSMHNWQKLFLTEHPNCIFWIASFGLNNQYKHPDKTVIRDLAFQQNTLVTCHEAQGVTIVANTNTCSINSIGFSPK